MSDVTPVKELFDPHHHKGVVTHRLRTPLIQNVLSAKSLCSALLNPCSKTAMESHLGLKRSLVACLRRLLDKPSVDQITVKR